MKRKSKRKKNLSKREVTKYSLLINYVNYYTLKVNQKKINMKEKIKRLIAKLYWAYLQTLKNL
ncbi:hypothetical protein T190607A02C_110061 [Tenacibaculum sp. 190524A02b]